MSLFQKIWSIVLTLIVIAGSVVMILNPIVGHYVIICILALTLIANGVKSLIYYFSMAKHMVGGKSVFYKGIILLSSGAFTLTLYDIPQWFITLYMVGICLFCGFIAVMRAREMRKNESAWKFKMFEGLVYFALSVVGLSFIHSEQVAVYIYCAALLYYAVMRIVAAFKPTSVIYIQ